MYASFDFTRRIVPGTSTSFVVPTPPAFPLSGAAIDLYFSGNQIYPSGAFSDYLSCSRASDGYAKNSAGTWVQFSSNVLRITDLGLLSEDSRTNYLLQSESPATQTTGSLATGSYTLWVEGSGSALASAGTATITGAASATEGSPNTFQVTSAGTVVVTVTGTLTRFQLENGTFATSYILTTIATAVRAADFITCIGNLDTLVCALPQSIVIDVLTPISMSGSSSQWIFFGDTSLGVNLLYDAQNETTLTSRSGGGANFLTQTGLSDPSYSVGVKIGVALATNARSVTAQGIAVVSDTNASAGTSGQMGLGTFPSQPQRIRRATFWSSKLADAALEDFTAP